MHRIIHNSPVSRSPKFVRPPSNTRSVSRSLQVVRPPSNTRPSTRVDVRGAVPSVQPPISAADIGALMLLGLQNPKSILFALAVAILAQAPGAEAAPYEEKPAWNSVYKAVDSTTHAPSNGIRQSITIRSVKLPPANVPLPPANVPLPLANVSLPPANVSLPPASPTGAPGSGASSSVSLGEASGMIIALSAGFWVAKVAISALCRCASRCAAAEPQQSRREVAPAPLNEVVIELPVVAEPQQPARNASVLNDVVIELPVVGDTAGEGTAV